jgi:hypothetical protein
MYFANCKVVKEKFSICKVILKEAAFRSYWPARRAALEMETWAAVLHGFAYIAGIEIARAAAPDGAEK